MTGEEHKALMIKLHIAQSEAETKILNRLKYWEDRRDSMLEKFGKLDEMTEAQKMNFEVIASTIIDIRSYHKATKELSDKYQQMYKKQVDFIQTVYQPGFKLSLINEMMKDINQQVKP